MTSFLQRLRIRLRADHILGMNRRNLQYIQAKNPRAHYPLADDKILAKKLMVDSGLPVPETIAVVNRRDQIDTQVQALHNVGGFVVKPSRGFGGAGVLVITRSEDGFHKPSGDRLTDADLRLHMASILAGMFALDHIEDAVLIERLVRDDSVLSKIHGGIGVSDLRIIVQDDVPVMAMLRLPTRASNGTANLHQHGIGIGVDLQTGRTTYAVHDDQPINAHPDTGAALHGIAIPGWTRSIELAKQINTVFGMGYLGADIVLDADQGPVILEVNVRPGLAIQLANQTGLRAVLEGRH